MAKKAKYQQGSKILLPIKSLFAVLLVLVLVVGLFTWLTIISATGSPVVPFGVSRSTTEVADSETATLVSAYETDSGETTVELPIDEHYAHLYPNEAKLATFLSSKGLDDLHIAAVIGVFKRESGNGDYDISPEALEDNLIGHGIAQWSFERWAGARYDRPEQGLKYYAQDTGRNWEDLDVQLDYLWGEMTGEGPAAEYVYVQYDHAGFMATSSLEEAVDFYLAEFMNCAGAQFEDRLGFAQNLYAKIS